MKTILIVITTCLILNLQVNAEEYFSEIYLPGSDDSGTFVNILDNDNILTGSININKVQDENIYSEIIPHHKLFFGNVSVYKDKTSFSTIRSEDDLGVKLSGGSGILSYSAGIYNINNTGAWASFNPLHFFPETGKLEMGGGIFTNRLGLEDITNQKNTFNLFTGYKFKRFSTRGDFIRKDYTYHDDRYYNNWIFSNKFDLTKNLSLKAGYKEYEETKSMVNDFGVEYSIGNVKLEVDTSLIKYRDNNARDSRRFGVRTRYLF